jgi:hypothetical protein
MIRNYFQRVDKFKGSKKTQEVLTDLGKLYSFDQISHSQHLFSKVYILYNRYNSIIFKNEYYTDKQARQVRQGIFELLARLRPNAVAIVDAFDFSDRELHSVLGESFIINLIC